MKNGRVLSGSDESQQLKGNILKDFIPDIGAGMCLGMKMMNRQDQEQGFSVSRVMADSGFILLRQVTGVYGDENGVTKCKKPEG